ncbi:hypothetical protein FOA52_013715 [Chlamydomonas sp. UWO 241]|nr:hypothetical protein FOA52_013715 [Chlamydomonas sp. UWO 241]
MRGDDRSTSCATPTWHFQRVRDKRQRSSCATPTWHFQRLRDERQRSRHTCTRTHDAQTSTENCTPAYT